MSISLLFGVLNCATRADTVRLRAGAYCKPPLTVRDLPPKDFSSNCFATRALPGGRRTTR
jgi:hypothetical protein